MSSRPRGRKFSGRQKAKHRARNIRANDHAGTGRFRRKRNPAAGMMAKSPRSAPLLLTAALLAGCVSGPETPRSDPYGPDTPADAFSRIAEVREDAGTAPPGELGRLEEVRIPVAEAWLDRPLQARFRDVRADHAIRAVVQDRPVRFEMDLSADATIPRVRREGSSRTIREHLDAIAVQADWSWSVQSGVVRVRDIETRRFALASQPGSYAAGLALRNLNESGRSLADNRTDLTLDPYANEILQQVQNVLGQDAPAGGGDSRTRVTVAPSANLLTVTARPNTMVEVAALVDDFNAAVGRIVRVSLSLIEVDFRDGRDRDLALELIRRSARFPLRLLMGNSSGTTVDDGGVSITGIYTREGAREAGSLAVVQWLNTLGNASIAYDETIEVLNNRVASLDLTRTEGYVSSIRREPVDGTSRLSTEVEFDDLRTGLVVHLQPTVSSRPAGRITLTLGFSRSSLVGRRPYNFGDVQGETFITDDLNRFLSITLRDGEPRLLASLSETETQRERSRVPIFGRFGIGTSNNRSFREREMVMVITATVIDG